MNEDEIIELLGEIEPAWRSYFDDPYEAAEYYNIPANQDSDEIQELRF